MIKRPPVIYKADHKLTPVIEKHLVFLDKNKT